MNVRKVVTGSVLAAGLGVAGLFGPGMASADVSINPTTNDAYGYGVANDIHNVIQPAGGHGVGFRRSDQTQPDPNTFGGVNRIEVICDSACVDTQGSPDSPGVFPPISNAGGNKAVPHTLARP